MGIRVKAVVTDHDLSFIGNMRDNSCYELQIIHGFLFWAVFAVLVTNFTFSLIKGEALSSKRETFVNRPYLSEPPSVMRIWIWGWKLIFDPKLCMTAIVPGVSFLPVTVRKYFKSACLPQRQSEERSERLNLKNIRSILGMVNTTWRWGVSRISFSRIHAPHSSRRLAWQEGQKPRVLQENIRSLSIPQSEHLIRANPHFGLPQSKYLFTTPCIMGRK